MWRVYVSGRGIVPVCSRVAILFFLDVALPESIAD